MLHTCVLKTHIHVIVIRKSIEQIFKRLTRYLMHGTDPQTYRVIIDSVIIHKIFVNANFSTKLST